MLVPRNSIMHEIPVLDYGPRRQGPVRPQPQEWTGGPGEHLREEHKLPILAVMEAQPSARFAHASEAEFARILDFYGIRWEYEPRSFPLEWSAEGRVVESFSPDFYLPDFDLYIELTTLKQSLVTRKNRKLRRLRELYPHVRVKMFYGRDYRNLLAKYDLQPSGTR